MTTITVDEDCGRSEEGLLRDLTVAFVKPAIQFILDNVAADIEWTTVGDQEI